MGEKKYQNYNKMIQQFIEDALKGKEDNPDKKEIKEVVKRKIMDMNDNPKLSIKIAMELKKIIENYDFIFDEAYEAKYERASKKLSEAIQQGIRNMNMPPELIKNKIEENRKDRERHLEQSIRKEKEKKFAEELKFIPIVSNRHRNNQQTYSNNEKGIAK